jgi:glycosyltransferase involved in cell wall biosynthesis
VTETSVIVCVRNGETTIGGQLAALAALDYPDPWELVVVDNGSTDATREVVSQWRARLPQLRIVPANERPGLAYARNVGVAAATGQLLAFCDADDVADPRWLSELIAGARHADIVGGRLEVELLNTELARRWRGLLESDLSRPMVLDYLPYAVGANFAVHREAFERVGGCDEAFRFCGDDVDLSWRIQRGGGRLTFREEAIMHYRLRPDLSGLMRQRYRYGHAEGLLRTKFADAVAPTSWRESVWVDRYLLKRSWHLAGGGARRGSWLAMVSHRAGQLRGMARHRAAAAP